MDEGSLVCCRACDRLLAATDFPVNRGRFRRPYCRWAFLYETVDAVWCSVSAGAEPILDEQRLLRLAGAHAADSALAVVEMMYKAGGGTAVYSRSPLDRQMRDVHAATQHIGVSSIDYELAGRIFLGMEPGSVAS